MKIFTACLMAGCLGFLIYAITMALHGFIVRTAFMLFMSGLCLIGFAIAYFISRARSSAHHSRF